MFDDGDEEVFVAPDEAPAWALKLFKTLEAVSVKLDDKLNSISQKFDNYKAKVDSDIKEFKNEISEKVANMEASVKFISDNFDKQASVNTGLHKEIAELKNELNAANERHANEIDSLEQYSRRNCVVLHGATEQENEDTDQLFINTIRDHLGVDIKVRDIDRSHRLGPKRTDGSARALIVKFARYNVRSRVFREKRKFKNSGLVLSESLTKRRVEMVNSARDKYGKANVWSSDGEIMVLKNSKKMNVRYL